MGRRKTDPQATIRLLNEEAQKATAGRGPPAIVFTSLLGTGAHGTVVTAKVSPGTLPVGSGSCQSLSSSDPHPAVKITEGSKEDLQSAEREYELARWASARKLGPAVYCSALWTTPKGVRHLLFMEHLWGTLSDLTEWRSRLTPKLLEAQRHAWLLAFLQTQTMSDNRLMGADLKPANFLVRFDGRDVTGVYITDWDDTFWFVADTKDDALLYDFFSLAVNTMLIVRSQYALDKMWIPDICQFASHLIYQWKSSPKFMSFLMDHDEVNKVGPYHYMEYYALKAVGPKLSKSATPEQRAKRFLAAFAAGITDRWGSRMAAAAKPAAASLAATRVGDKRFVVKARRPPQKPEVPKLPKTEVVVPPRPEAVKEEVPKPIVVPSQVAQPASARRPLREEPGVQSGSALG